MRFPALSTSYPTSGGEKRWWRLPCRFIHRLPRKLFHKGPFIREGEKSLDLHANYLYKVVVNDDGFEWDDAKAASNLVKHGVSFPYARTAFVDPRGIEAIDDRRDYREERLNLIAKSSDNIVLFVTYTERGARIRIISARRASQREVNVYDEQ